jgi:hypothetical protein
MDTPSGRNVTTSPRVGTERGDRRCHELLVLTEPHYEWTLFPHADERIGLIVTHCNKCIMTVEVSQGPPHRIRQITGIVECDQVSHDLGIGVRVELHQIAHEARTQLDMVLDDPIEDDADPTACVMVRVRVALSDCSVRCPSRMSDTDGTGDGVALDPITARGLCAATKRQFQRIEVADRTDAVHIISVTPRDPRRVVTPVLEPAQSVKQNRTARSVPHISDDSAHRRPPMKLIPDLITELTPPRIKRDTGPSSFTHLIATPQPEGRP